MSAMGPQQLVLSANFACQLPALCCRRRDSSIRGCRAELARERRISPKGATEEQFCQAGQARRSLSENSLPFRAHKELSMSVTSSQESIIQTISRRKWLLSSAALASVFYPDNAQGLARSADLAYGDVAVSDVEVSAEDVKKWYRYRGEGFVLRIPPGYEDVLDYPEEEESDSLYGARAEEKPFAARFASPDRDEVLSIVIKPASQLRLAFFETKDISDFGSIKDAASKFVPVGAQLVAAKVINSKASRVPRTYYMYEFLVKGMHFALSAGVAKGRVFVLGASSPQAKWKDYGTRLQLAASTFFLP